MTRECHVRFCERLRGKFLRPTHHFGMKVHVGADVHTGVAHTVSVTPANAADISQLPNLLREDDRMVIGDAGYVNDTYKRAAREAVVAAEPRRAPVPRDEAADRLHQDALPGLGEERRPGLYADWADQPLSEEACVDNLTGEVRPESVPRDGTGRKWPR